MISDPSHVALRLYSSDHDYFYWASLLGEPFLVDEHIVFFDGETASIVGFPLDRGHAHPAYLERLSSILASVLETFSPAFVNYFGLRDTDAKQLTEAGYHRHFVLKPNPFNVDVTLDLRDPRTLSSRAAKEARRKWRKKGFSFQANHVSFLSHNHISLIRDCTSRQDMWLSDVSYATAITSILRDQNTTLFEAFLRERLAGFAIAHEYFRGAPFLILVFTASNIPGTADALYLNIAEHYKSNGSGRLNIGYSVNPGLLQFKTKWGGAILGEPFHQSIWARADVEPSGIECLHWPSRLLLSNAHPEFKPTRQAPSNGPLPYPPG